MSKSVITALVVIVGVGLLFLCACSGSAISAHNNLVAKEQLIPQAESNLNATRATMANKLETLLNVLYNTYDSTYLTQVGVAEARSQFLSAQSSGDAQAEINATTAMVFAMRAVQENPPTLGFTEPALAAMSEVSESYSLYLQTIRDYNSVVKNFNTYRRQLIFPMLIANVEGLAAYQVYQVPEGEDNQLTPDIGRQAPEVAPGTPQ